MIPAPILFHRDDVPWYKATPHSRREPHRWQSRGIFHGEPVERCSCGAFGPAPWTFLDPPRYAPDAPDAGFLRYFRLRKKLKLKKSKS